MDLTAGTILQNGNYSLHQALGQSLRSLTFKATQVHSNRVVVIKTLNRLQPEANIVPLRQSFMERARRFGQCQHPGLVSVLDVFEEAGAPFVVMDYVAGQSLAAMVKASGPMTEAQAIQAIRQVGSALNALHRAGSVHGEVKPTNLIRPGGSDVVVLVDLGVMDRGSLLPSPAEAGLAMGNYAAIEQFTSEGKLTPATDVYALAATLYFLLTGCDPTPASVRQELPLLSLRQLQPHLSPTVEAAILSGMELHAASRPQTIAAWFSLLLNHNPSATVPTAPSHAKTRIEATDLGKNANGNLANGNLSNGNGAVSGRILSPVPPTVQSAIQPTRVVAPVSAPIVPSGSSIPKMPPSQQNLPKLLLMTAVITGAIGLGVGLVLRLGSVTGIGPKIFNPQQSFPPLDGWLNPSSDASPAAPTPTVPDVKRNLAPAPSPTAKPRSRPSPPPATPKVTPTPQDIAPASPFPSPNAPPEIPLPAPNPDIAPTDNPQPPEPKAPTSQAPAPPNKAKDSAESKQ